jgi:hypothetical protein
VKFNPKGLITTAAWILVLVTALKTQTAGAIDGLSAIALAIVLLISSVALLVARIRGLGAIGPAGALRGIRTWLPILLNHL